MVGINYKINLILYTICLAHILNREGMKE